MAKAKQQAEVVDVADHALVTTEDEQFAINAGRAVQSFLHGLAGFFATANAIEQEAVTTLAHAKKWKLNPPKTAAEDVSLQQLVKGISQQKAIAVTHWDGVPGVPGITRLLHGWHTRSVLARTRTTGTLDEAATIGNRLHNEYVEADRRRVEEERRQNEREAQERAERIRQQELAEMEAAALQAEEGSPQLSERETRFVEIASIGIYSSARCAQQAGFKDPDKAAARLLGMPKIQAALEAKRKALAIRKQAEAVKASPLDPVSIPEVESRTERAAGVRGDKTTWRADCFDESSLIDAVIRGVPGIPRDVICADLVRLNQYARDMHRLIDRWPGVRAVSNTKVV